MSKAFASFADSVSRATGSPWAFVIAVIVIVVWGCSGPLLGFSDTWQLIINTGTTIVTFLMVFVLQSTQSRDSTALQAKLDELIRASQARDDLIGIDKRSLPEVEEKRDEQG